MGLSSGAGWAVVEAAGGRGWFGRPLNTLFDINFGADDEDKQNAMFASLIDREIWE